MILFKFFVTCLLCLVHGEEFNLIGEAGQAYSLEVYLGHPKQKVHLIVDTGSTTLAVASYSRRDHDEYFHIENSTTLLDSGKIVQAKYSQGNWTGHYVSDFVDIPSIKEFPELRSDFAVITESYKFFMNGSGWQGLLGLAYHPVGAWGDHIIVGSWLDSIECYKDKPVSFSLKLCGASSPTNATHYGKFELLFSTDSCNENCPNRTDELSPFKTPILHKRWYEVGVLSIYLKTPHEINETLKHSDVKQTSVFDEKKINMCQKLNGQKSIVDSGTTNIRLPDEIYIQVVEQLRKAVQSSDLLNSDEFWLHGEAVCWSESQEWLELPWLAVDLLSDSSDYEYFTLDIPPQNYMRVVTAQNSTGEKGAMSQFCYKLGIESGGLDTVLGYTAMEGYKVIFNRSASWVSWQPTNCGPKARLSGPYSSKYSLFKECQLPRSDSEVATSIKAAQWTLGVVSIIAAFVLVYLLAPCVKTIVYKRRQSRASSLRDALVDQELN